MEFLITIDDTHNFFLIETRGDFDLIDFQKLAAALLKNPSWRVGSNCIFDYRKTNFLAVSKEDLMAVTKMHEKNNSIIGKGKSAFIMKDIGNFGMGNMYKGRTEYYVDTKFEIFTDFDKAKKWMISEETVT
ncbi:MAG: hypothetical protein HGB26_09245 [Desulfobulbaceae bacterium]|nr:hypothetical protein [Desulfobulbaceae bacterium]